MSFFPSIFGRVEPLVGFSSFSVKKLPHTATAKSIIGQIEGCRHVKAYRTHKAMRLIKQGKLSRHQFRFILSVFCIALLEFRSLHVSFFGDFNDAANTHLGNSVLEHTYDNTKLDLTLLATSRVAKELIASFRNDTVDLSLSVRNLTQQAFSHSEIAFSGARPSNFSAIQEIPDIIQDIWNNARESSSKVVWLVDLIGDSYTRAQYRVFLKSIQNGRKAETDEQFGEFKQTYHRDHVFCCPWNVELTCTVRLNGLTFNTTIHNQIKIQSNEILLNGGETAMCISWQWSRFSNDEFVFKHLKEHESSEIVPRGVVLNQALHCAFKHNFFESDTFCTEQSRRDINDISHLLSKSHGIHFAVDTSTMLALFAPKTNPRAVNARVMDLNKKIKRSFTSRNNTGANAHIWVRDIEQWSLAFHANPSCVRSDGVHISCVLFTEVYVW